MKHKRQTLSKDETDIKTPKSKSESGGLGVGEGGKARVILFSFFADFLINFSRVAGAALLTEAWAARAVSCLQEPRVLDQSRMRTKRSR